MKRDLGVMGEREFEKKCASVGITTNASNIDRNGWDSILEIDHPEANKAQMLDKKPPQIKCLVQVKATDSKTINSWSIKLSNLKKLVDFAGPTFVVLMRFSGKEDVQEVCLVHLDKSIIQRVMKKLRQLSGDKKDPSKSKLTIHFEKDRLHKPTGICIKEKIIGVIPNLDIDLYISKKQKTRDLVGYENGHHKILFTLKDADAKKAFSEAMLGIQCKIPVVNVIQKLDTRFNIPATIIKEKEALISFKTHPVSIKKVFFQGSHPSEYITFSGDVYLEPSSKTIRWDFKIFYLMYNLELKTIEWKVEPTNTNETYSLKLLNKFYSLLLMVIENKSLFVGVETENKIQPFSEMSIEISNDGKAYFENQKNLCSSAKKILTHFSIIDISTNQILLNKQSSNLSVFSKVLDNISEPVRVTLPPLDKLILEENRKYTTIFPVVVYLGNYLFCSILKITGFYVKKKEQCQCLSNESILLETFHLSKKDADKVYEMLDQKLIKWSKKEDAKTTITINQISRKSEKYFFDNWKINNE